MLYAQFQNTNNDFPAAMIEETEKEIAAFSQKSSSPKTMAEYENHYENQLKETLEEVIGISDVTVMINLDATEKKVHELNVKTSSQNTDETDREGGKRKVTDNSIDEQVVIVRINDTEVPVIVKTEKPVVRGVLIVAKGAENIQIKQWIVEAVSRVLDVPSHKVSVLPKK
jgi:stage III sporulation protein AG